jgi:hypothetical protein
MTKRSCNYRDLLMQAALQVSQVVHGPPARQLATVEPRCLSAYLGFEAARYRLHLRRAGK